MSDNIPEGYYRGRNGRLYKAKNKSLIQRVQEAQAAGGSAEDELDPGQSGAQLLGYNANYSQFRGVFDWPDSFEVIAAPTSDKSGKKDKRDRAIECGYHHASETLVVIFRAPVVAVKGSPGTYKQRVNAAGMTLPPPVIRYNGVPVDQWDSLKLSGSTGRYLRESGIDGLGYEETTIPGLHSEFS
jgi:hypothetical protein